jgi:hypothetical protein
MHRAHGRSTHGTRLRGTARAAEHAQQPCHLSERSAVEPGLRGGDLLGLQDVEFTTYFVP